MARRMRLLGGGLVALAVTLSICLLVCFALVALAPPPAASASWGGRLAAWCAALLHGDFGYSLAFHRPIASLLRDRLPATLALVGLACLLAVPLALAWSLVSALLDGRPWAAPLRAAGGLVAALWTACPVGAVALLALLVAPFAAALHRSLYWAPHWPWLPAAVLAFALIPVLQELATRALRVARAAPFGLAARARGVGPRRLLRRYLLPHAAASLLPLTPRLFANLLAETVIVATLLGWPGLGQLAVQALAARDLPVLAAVLLCVGLLVIALAAVTGLLRLALALPAYGATFGEAA